MAAEERAAPRAERRPVSQRRWQCHPLAILCERGDHLLAFYESGYRANQSGLYGHAFYSCTKCEPRAYWLAVYSPKPSPVVWCFALSRESYMEWEPRADDTPPTDELLYHLRDPDGKSYSPYWRPATTRRTG